MARSALGVIALAFLCCLPPALGLYGPSSDVLTLTPENFKSKVLKSDSVVLVEFFAPWCGHCKNLQPQYDKAATALKGVAVVAAVDADAHKSLGAEYGVQGFPTIKAFIPGQKKPIDYQGAREAKPMVDWVLQQAKSLVSSRLSGKKSSSSGGGSGGGKEGKESAVVTLTDSNFEKEVLQSGDLWMVEFFAPWCGHCKALAPEWKKVAGNLKGKVKLGAVDCTVETSLASKYDVKGFPTILVFGADKQSPQPYEQGRTASAIEDYALRLLETSAVAPEVVEMTDPAAYDKACGNVQICFLSFLPHILDSGAAGRNAYIATLKATAEKHKRRPYGYVWAEAGAQPELENAVGVGGYGYPAMVGLNAKKGVYSSLRGAFADQSISAFVANPSTGVTTISAVPPVKTVQPWDGKDGQLEEEEEFSLDDLMKEEL
eukprot:TRINITY_DN14160_c0_g1_i1.p1 TRINITY_DN14160_c0_g1~~TRINITY_DN14160_c0_g1_i1.p1  ORF type:complete len:431 (-),score=124.05 TRINITY_DN14160_c0_g1_i1:277-1569(-)